MSGIVFALITSALAIACGLWLGLRLSRRLGSASLRDWTQERRGVGLISGLYLLALSGISVAFATRNPGIGIAIMVAVFVLPTFFTTPLRIRRARRDAEQARVARDAENTRRSVER